MIETRLALKIVTFGRVLKADLQNPQSYPIRYGYSRYSQVQKFEVK